MVTWEKMAFAHARQELAGGQQFLRQSLHACLPGLHMLGLLLYSTLKEVARSIKISPLALQHGQCLGEGRRLRAKPTCTNILDMQRVCWTTEEVQDECHTVMQYMSKKGLPHVQY
jgi:hypothetical protein